MGIQIVRSKIVFTLPVRCINCGFIARSKEICFDTVGLSMEELDSLMKKQTVGTKHPVGWASYWTGKGTVYRCPGCKC